MKTIKNLALALTFVFATMISFAQEIKGFTFKITNYANSEDEYQEIYTTSQLYNVSLTDGFAVHTVFNENGTINDSQFYKVKSYKVTNDSKEIIIKMTITSGISGKDYKYSLHVSNDYEILSWNDGEVIYVGTSTTIKTFKK